MFTLYQCLLTKNDCYKKGEKITPKGIVVHSTGADNPYLKRYVQPDDGYLGNNIYNNSWNRPKLDVCVHAFIGYDKYKNVKCYQTLPFDYACWGVGRGSKGSYNYNPTGYIQFEMCEDNLKNEDYFNQVMDVATDFCVYLCRMFNLKIENVVSHHEAYLRGYGSNHSDCDHWLKKFGKDMNWFREIVKQKMGEKPTPSVPNAYVNSKDGLWLHSQKNFKTSSNICLMGYKDQVEWLSTDGAYAYIDYKGTKGYCSKKYLTKEENAIVNSTNGLWLHRTKDFKTSSNICLMGYKDKVNWLSTEGNFAYVDYKGTKGYCSKNYLKRL